MPLINSKSNPIIRSIGIPRSLLYYRYGALWTAFFQELGYDVILSEPTDKALVEAGDALLVDESCLASKVFIGHVDSLIDRCDALFVPSYGNDDHRAGYCTKFQAQQDLVRNIFNDRDFILLTLRVNNAPDVKETKRAFIDLAQEMGHSPRDAHKAWKRAFQKQERALKQAATKQEKTIKLLDEYRSVVAKDKTGTEQEPLGILLVAHPYISHDDYLCGGILDTLKDLDVTVLFADETNRFHARKKSFEFSRTMPWIVNRELVGSILLLQDKVDGIILVSAFPCGPDSMTNDAIMRCIQGLPILNLMIDAQSGTAGVETRIESFVDILRFQKEGGYTHHGE